MKRHTQNEASLLFAKHGIKLIGTYASRTQPVTCKCTCGSISEITLHQVQRNRKCTLCNAKNNPVKTPLTHSEVKNELLSLGIVVLSQYHKFHSPMHLRCVCGNEFFMSLPNVRKGRRCGCKIQKGDKHHAWIEDRTALKLSNKFKKACYTLVARSLKGRSKKSKTQELLGYTSDQLQKHITSHPKYDSCAKTKKRISIDHIFPLKAFEDYGILSETYIWLINHLENLQPSIASWNSSKNDSYDKLEFESFLTKHKINFSTC